MKYPRNLFRQIQAKDRSLFMMSLCMTVDACVCPPYKSGKISGTFMSPCMT
jgi:hypothetical protein